MSTATNVVPMPSVPALPGSTSIDFRSVLGIQVGRDTANNFAASLNGLAVKTWDGRYVVPTPDRKGGQVVATELQDVTGLTLPVDPFVFRVPVPTVEPGNLIVMSDTPFHVLSVEAILKDSKHI